MLNQSDKNILLQIARSSLDRYILETEVYEVKPEDYPENLRIRTGAFVSLHRKGKLRGCIGRFRTDLPVCTLVRDMAISAATRDYRFKPVKKNELADILIEISVLTPLEPVKDENEIELGRHGIYIKQGPNSGTFLPQVATETGWSLEEYLGHCARDKAGIGWKGWKNAELFRYEAIIFGENRD